MPIQFPNEADKIREIVRQRNIQWLVHFTHINNINSIVEHGILPRLETEQLNNNIGGNFVFPDPSRADRKNASCLSIMFPNSKMLWHKRQQYPDKDWVFLMLEPDILWECDCAFYPTNAASTGVRYQPVKNFKTAVAFEAMFADEVIRETTCVIETISRPQLQSYLPTDVQAEILVFDTISPEYIIEIFFHSSHGDMDSLTRENANFKNIEVYPNAEWVKNKEGHMLLYGFRENVDWK